MRELWSESDGGDYPSGTLFKDGIELKCLLGNRKDSEEARFMVCREEYLETAHLLLDRHLEKGLQYCPNGRDLQKQIAMVVQVNHILRYLHPGENYDGVLAEYMDHVTDFDSRHLAWDPIHGDAGRKLAQIIVNIQILNWIKASEEKRIPEALSNIAKQHPDYLVTQIAAALGRDPQEAIKTMANSLYWDWEAIVDPELVLNTFGPEAIEPFYYQDHCIRCEDDRVPMFQTRRERDLYKSPESGEIVCEKCRRKEIGELKTLARADYRAYLQTEHWQAKRQEKLAEVGMACQVCNANKALNVHHRRYDHIGEEPLLDLIVLCQECHELFHNNGKLAPPEPETTAQKTGLLPFP